MKRGRASGVINIYHETSFAVSAVFSEYGMELIKQIKEAETKAKEMVASAHRQVTMLADGAAKRREEAFAKARQRRKEAVAAAVDRAGKEAEAEAEQYKQKAMQQREGLAASARSKMGGAAEEVLNYLRGLR